MAYPLKPTSLPAQSTTRHEVPFGSTGRRLIDIYSQYFEVIRAETPEQLSACFRLRYQVYCVENPFEDPQQSSKGMEIDQFDAAAMHSLLLHRETGEMVGTVRLILPCSEKDGMGLPIRQICRHELMSQDNSLLPWCRTAEISRFAVSKMMRRRAGDGTVVGSFQTFDCDPRRRIPDTSLGLMQAVIAMAAKSRMTHLCAVMEPTLLRMLRRLGMLIPSVGQEVDYHGRRQPVYSDLDTALARIWLQRPEVWELLTSDGDYWPLNKELVAKLQKTNRPSPRRH